MRIRAFPHVVLLGLLTLALVPGLAGAAGQGQDLAGTLASSAAERATAVSGAVISVSPSSHDFGRINVGSSSGNFVFTISNTGQATLTISSITHSAPGFSATAGSLTVPAGGSTTLTTSYSPASGSGPQSDNVTISSNADNGAFSVLLSGVANNAPTYSPPLAADYTAPAFVAFSLTASATDPEGDALSWSISSVPALPVGATFDGANGTLNWTPGSADAGNYAVTITVTDGVASTPGNFTLHVTSGNNPPTARPGGPYSGVTGIPLSIDGSASSDPDAGQTLTYAWNFGDGSSGVGPTVSHTYAVAGNYIISLTVTDNGSPVLSHTATTGASIVDFVPVDVVLPTGIAPILKKNGNMLFGIESPTRPLTDIDPNSFVITTTYPNSGSVTEVAISLGKKGVVIGDINGNLFFDLDIVIKGSVLRPLFSNVPAGTVVTVVFNARTSGDNVPVRGTIDLVKQGGAGAAAFQGVSSSASPNPFKPETTIRYRVSGAGPVSIRVFSVNGSLVRTLREQTGSPGSYEVRWNGKDDGGRTAPSGIYFVSVKQGFETSTTRVVLAR